MPGAINATRSKSSIQCAGAKAEQGVRSVRAPIGGRNMLPRDASFAISLKG